MPLTDNQQRLADKLDEAKALHTAFVEAELATDADWVEWYAVYIEAARNYAARNYVVN